MNRKKNTLAHLVFILIILPLYSRPTHAQMQFEGIVETKNLTVDEHGSRQEFTMTMYVSKNALAIKNSAVGETPASTIIYRGDKKVVWMLNEEDSTYFEIRQDEQPHEIRGQSGGKVPTVKLTKKTRTLVGYPCEQIVVKDNDMETELWATKSLGHLYSTITKALGAESGGQGWENKVMEMGYYPLVAITKVGGKVMESQEVTRIEKKSVPRTMFELPSGYRKQVNEGMMDGRGR